MSLRIHRVGEGWDLYPAVKFHWAAAVTEWADTVGPHYLETLRAHCPVNRRPHFYTRGRLVASLRMERHLTGSRMRMEFTANTPYARPVIGGADMHDMYARNFPHMHWWDRPEPGREYFAWHVIHPGQSANNFQERAMDRDEGYIIHQFTEIMENHLRRALER